MTRCVLEAIEVWEEVATGIVHTTAIILAIYAFTKGKNKIKGVYNSIRSFANQLSHMDLRLKISKLEGLELRDNRKDIINILSEIEGQIKVNPFLFEIAESQYRMIESYTSKNSTLTDRKLANLIGQLKEVLRIVPAEPYEKGSGNHE